jgi:hypothetical protein
LEKHPIADLVAVWDRGFMRKSGNAEADAQGYGFPSLWDASDRLSAKPQLSQS